MKLNQELNKNLAKIFLEYKVIKLWFNLGGPAEYFFKPESKKQLIEFLKDNKKINLNTVLGIGSITLIRDRELRVAIKLGPIFSK